MIATRLTYDKTSITERTLVANPDHSFQKSYCFVIYETID